MNEYSISIYTFKEIDHYWEKLGENGRYDRCGWLADEFGISWQIVPTCLPRLITEKRSTYYSCLHANAKV